VMRPVAQPLCLSGERGAAPLRVAIGQSAGRNTVSKTVEVGFDSSLACGLVQKAALLVRSEKVRVRFSAGPQGRAKKPKHAKEPRRMCGLPHNEGLCRRLHLWLAVREIGSVTRQVH